MTRSFALVAVVLVLLSAVSFVVGDQACYLKPVGNNLIYLCPPGKFCKGLNADGSGAGQCIAFSTLPTDGSDGSINPDCLNAHDGDHCAPTSGTQYTFQPSSTGSSLCTWSSGGAFTGSTKCLGYSCLSTAGLNIECTGFQYDSSPPVSDIRCAYFSPQTSSSYSIKAWDTTDPTRYFCDLTTTVLGDPMFTGFRGQPYQVHGIDGAIYNLITHKSHQINSKFGFLMTGQCPVRGNNSRTSPCWSHPGSYITEAGVQQHIGSQLVRVLLTAGSARDGFSSVIINGKALSVGDDVTFTEHGDKMRVQFIDSHYVSIVTPLFTYDMDNSDMFINQATKSNVPVNRLNSHGLLGQTWSTQVYNSSIKYIEGEVDDYVIGNDDIFGTDFVFNLFETN